MMRKIIIPIGVLLLMVMFLVGAQSYFSHKEINLASERCLEIGGVPQVTSGFLTINYSFSCDANK